MKSSNADEIMREIRSIAFQMNQEMDPKVREGEGLHLKMTDFIEKLNTLKTLLDKTRDTAAQSADIAVISVIEKEFDALDNPALKGDEFGVS